MLDYKTGNVDSVVKSVKLLGLFSFEKINEASKIIMPEQGAYNYAVDN